MNSWIYKENEAYDKTFTDKLKKTWKCRTVKSMKSENDIKIVGDIDLKQRCVRKNYLCYGENLLRIEDYRKRSRFTYQVVGYIECSSDGEIGYVRVVRDSFLRNLILCMLILLILLVGLFWWFQRDPGPVLEEAAIAYKAPLAQPENTDKTKIAIPGYGDLPMKENTDELYAAFVNPEGNECYFKYQVIRKSDNKMLFETKLIKPGMAVTKIQLSETMKKGTYPVKIVILTYDLDDYKKQLNGGVVETTITAR